MYYAIHKQTKRHRIVDHDTPVSENENIVLADAYGWIEWHGGESPLPDEVGYEIEYQCGRKESHAGDASKHNTEWYRDSHPFDIVAYRPILEEISCRTAKKDVGMHARDTLRDDFSVDEPTQWRGPQNGLPPVGLTCEVKGSVMDELHGREKDWVMCEVLAHTRFSEVGAPIAVAKVQAHTGMAWGIAHTFRPIRTASEIAEERAIDAMAKHGQCSFANETTAGMVASGIYNAIAAGKITGVACKPEPFRGELKSGQVFYRACLEGVVDSHVNHDNDLAVKLVKKGRVFLTRREALLFAAFESESQ